MDKDNFFTRFVEGVRSTIEGVFPGKSNTVLFGVIGLIAALLLLSVGFWRMLIISIFVFIGVAVGQTLDGNPKLLNWIKDLFSDKD